MPRDRRCAAPDCSKWATDDSRFCHAHTKRAPEPAPVAVCTRETMSEAMAAKVTAAGNDLDLAGELGSIRLALATVLTDVDDPKTQAVLIARLATAAAQIAKAKRALSGEQAESITDAFTQILLELGEHP